MRVHRFRPDGHRRKASVVLVVVGLHALLLAVRLPPAPQPNPGPASAPISVVLIPAPALQPVARAEPSRERPRATAKAKAGPRAALADPRPTQAALRQQPTQPAAAMRSAPLGLPLDPALAPLRTPPSLAEQAHARSGDATPEGALSRGVARSARPDCKEVYAGLVLLAIPALLVDTVRDKGCKW